MNVVIKFGYIADILAEIRMNHPPKISRMVYLFNRFTL